MGYLVKKGIIFFILSLELKTSRSQAKLFDLVYTLPQSKYSAITPRRCESLICWVNLNLISTWKVVYFLPRRGEILILNEPSPAANPEIQWGSIDLN